MKQKEIGSNLSYFPWMVPPWECAMMTQDVTLCLMQWPGRQHSFPLTSVYDVCGLLGSLQPGLWAPLGQAGPLPSACGFLSRAEQGGTSVPQVWPAGLP